MTDVRLLYVTTKDNDQARTIARELLDQRLIACANILPQMESLYRWNGEVQNDKESVLILKTSASLVARATEAVLKLHSYETPCVLELKIESGAKGYLDWLAAEVK
jgi:periplasmic divalent cation tolerance protein